MSGTNNNPGNLHNTNPPLNYLQPPNNNPMTGLPVTNAPIPGVNTASPYSTVSMQSPYTQGSIPTSGVTPQPPINTNALLAILGQLNSLAPKQPDIPMDPNQMGNLFNMYPQFPYMPPNLGTYNPPMNPYEPKVKESYRPTRRSDAIIVCNLPPDITVDKLAEEFEKYGKLKYDRSKTPHQPLIILYYDGNSPKGEAKVIFEEPDVAESAVRFYNGKNLYGNGPLNVHLANPPNRDWDWKDKGKDKRDRYGYDKPRSFSGKGGAPREGDWICPSCNNNNFSWREFCHQCGREKTHDVQKVVLKSQGPSRGSRKVGTERRSNRNDPY